MKKLFLFLPAIFLFACSNTEEKSKIDDIIKKFILESEVAESTPRVSLNNPLSRLGNYLIDLEKINVGYGCNDLKAAAVNNMQIYRNGILSFAGNSNSNNDTYTSEITEAKASLTKILTQTCGDYREVVSTKLAIEKQESDAKQKITEIFSDNPERFWCRFLECTHLSQSIDFPTFVDRGNIILEKLSHEGLQNTSAYSTLKERFSQCKTLLSYRGANQNIQLNAGQYGCSSSGKLVELEEVETKKSQLERVLQNAISENSIRDRLRQQIVISEVTNVVWNKYTGMIGSTACYELTNNSPLWVGSIELTPVEAISWFKKTTVTIYRYNVDKEPIAGLAPGATVKICKGWGELITDNRGSENLSGNDLRDYRSQVAAIEAGVATGSIKVFNAEEGPAYPSKNVKTIIIPLYVVAKPKISSVVFVQNPSSVSLAPITPEYQFKGWDLPITSRSTLYWGEILDILPDSYLRGDVGLALEAELSLNSSVMALGKLLGLNMLYVNIDIRKSNVEIKGIDIAKMHAEKACQEVRESSCQKDLVLDGQSGDLFKCLIIDQRKYCT